MSRPTISAIITTFNRNSLLKYAIGSVLNQTYKDFELIILDNSSTDNSETVVKNFNDSRIRYIKHLPLNIAQARNLGVKEARGEYVGFLDDDDEWLPNKLSEQIAKFKSLNSLNIETFKFPLGLVYGGFLRVKNGQIFEVFKPTLRGDILQKYLCDRDLLTGSASNPLILKSAILDVGGYDNKLKCSEDWEFYLRLFRKYSADFVEKPILKIRQHSGGRLGDKLRDAMEADISVFNNFQDILEKCPIGKSFLLQAIGGKYCRLGEVAVGRKFLREAIKNNFWNWRAYFQYLWSFFGQGFYTKVHSLYKKLINF